MFYAPLVLELLIYLTLGIGAGFAAGLLGVGGGLIIVPALALLLAKQTSEFAMHMAVATSLATIVFTGASSVLAHHRRGNVLWTTAGWLAPGLIVGSFAGAQLATLISGSTLARIFGAFCLVTAWQLWRTGAQQERNHALPAAALTAAGGLIGTISALVGIGGGSLTVPLLIWRGESAVKAVATAAVGGVPIALAGAVGFVLAGRHESLPEPSLGFVYLPALFGIVITSVLLAPVGARVAQQLSGTKLKRVFALFLLVMGIGLWVS